MSNVDLTIDYDENGKQKITGENTDLTIYYDSAGKKKVTGISGGAGSVSSVNGQVGDVYLDGNDIAVDDETTPITIKESLNTKADKTPAEPDIQWGASPIDVPAGRILNINTSKTPDYSASTQVSCYGYSTVPASNTIKFGVWTNGDGHTHVGQFKLNASETAFVAVQDVYNDTQGWLSDQYLIVYGLLGIHFELSDMPAGTFNFDTDITVRSEGVKNLADVETQITAGLSQLSLRKLNRQEAAEIYDTKPDVDAKIAQAQLANQVWLPAVQTKAQLPASVPSDTVNYLCRVVADSTTANNGVYQWIAGATEWTYFSDNLDFVDEAELEAALAPKADSADLGALALKDKIANADIDDSAAIAKGKLASDVQTSLGKADTALQSFTETDPTVPSWAKASTKPSYNFSEIGSKPTTLSGYGITDAQSPNITTTAPAASATQDTGTTETITAKVQRVENNIADIYNKIPSGNIKTLTDGLGGSGTFTRTYTLHNCYALTSISGSGKLNTGGSAGQRWVDNGTAQQGNANYTVSIGTSNSDWVITLTCNGTAAGSATWYTVISGIYSTVDIS